MKEKVQAGMKLDDGTRVIPLGNRLIVRRQAKDEKTPSGILWLPDTAQEKPQQGVVLAIGEGKTLDDGTIVPIETVEVGDTVLFAKYGGNEIKDKKLEEDIIILHADDLFAVLRD